jgi:hypothetical protein
MRYNEEKELLNSLYLDALNALPAGYTEDQAHEEALAIAQEELSYHLGLKVRDLAMLPPVEILPEEDWTLDPEEQQLEKDKTHES